MYRPMRNLKEAVAKIATQTRCEPLVGLEGRAWAIKKSLNLPENAGLEGLKKALGFRIYSRVNVQSIIDEGPGSFIFQMNKCRVQLARKRKSLTDYPCKSGGLVEYIYLLYVPFLYFSS